MAGDAKQGISTNSRFGFLFDRDAGTVSIYHGGVIDVTWGWNIGAVDTSLTYAPVCQIFMGGWNGSVKFVFEPADWVYGSGDYQPWQAQ